MYESLEIATNAKFFLFEKNAEKKTKKKNQPIQIISNFCN